MLNTYVIANSTKSLNNIKSYSTELKIEKLINMKEFSDFEELENFKLIFFILDPYKIGDKNFINDIGKILKKRKDKRSIIFSIDNIEKLEKREILKVQRELKISLANLIESPVIKVISSIYAKTFRLYEDKLITVNEIAKNKELVFLDEEDFVLSNDEIKEKDIISLFEKSNIKEIIETLDTKLKYLEKFNPMNNNWSVLGNTNTGKTTLIEILKENFAGSTFIEEDIKNFEFSYLQNIILVLEVTDFKCEKIMELFSNVKYEKLLVVINKMEDFIFLERNLEDIKVFIGNHINKHLEVKPYFISANNYNLYLSYLNEEYSMSDYDIEKILLWDEYGMPIIKFIETDYFKSRMEECSFVKEIERMGKEIC